MPVPTPSLGISEGTLGVLCDDERAEERPTLRGLYEAHWAFVWRALRALGVRESELEDQVHEVFLVVHRRLDDFEGRSKATTWLWSITARVASDWRRRAHVRREHITDTPPEAPPDASGAPDVEIERAQARATLEWILDTMNPEQRVVFSLYELDGMSAEEIAALTQTAVNTVYSRLRLARRHFERGLARARARGTR